jgi:hypothetical protein
MPFMMGASVVVVAPEVVSADVVDVLEELHPAQARLTAATVAKARLLRFFIENLLVKQEIEARKISESIQKD